MLVAAVVSGSGVSGHAADPDLPPPDPPFHWRYVTQDPATTDSQCIGDPKTPECAIDTYIACYVRNDGRLCAAVGLTVEFTRGPSRGRFSRYQISSSRRLTAAGSPPILYGVGQMTWQPGDIEVVTRRISCSGGQCGGGEFQMKYVLRRSADRWIVVGKGAPRGP